MLLAGLALEDFVGGFEEGPGEGPHEKVLVEVYDLVEFLRTGLGVEIGGVEGVVCGFELAR